MPKKKNKRDIPVKPTFRIFCEGEKTEPQYLRSLIEDKHPGKRNLLVVEDCKPNTPKEIVQVAVESKRAGHRNDEVWVVYDREAVNKYSHQLHRESRDLAERNDIEISFSNICFEYWLLLHFENSSSQYGSYKDLIRKSNLKSHFRKQGIEYDKATPQIYELTKANLDDAVSRAKRIRRAAIGTAQLGQEAPHYLNPYVNIDELIGAMDAFVEQYG